MSPWPVDMPNTTPDAQKAEARRMAHCIAAIHPPIDGTWKPDERATWIADIAREVLPILARDYWSEWKVACEQIDALRQELVVKKVEIEQAVQAAYEDAAQIAESYVVIRSAQWPSDALIQEAIKNHVGTHIAVALRARPAEAKVQE